jgi:hypothetical protein
MRGPDTREYLVRFPSPSPHVDTAYTRVYEPFDAPADAPLPTLIFGPGLAVACDSIEYWTGEEYVGRELTPEGYRVVLPIPPWHGRREVPGSYTGTPMTGVGRWGRPQSVSAGSVWGDRHDVRRGSLGEMARVDASRRGYPDRRARRRDDAVPDETGRR